MTKLSVIFDLQMGKTPARAKSEYWNNGDNDWVSIADLSTYNKYVCDTKETISDLAVADSGIKLVPANTVIMSFKLTIGKTALTVKPIYTNEAIMAFIPKGKYAIYPDYFYHFFTGRDWSKGTNRAVMGSTLNKATLGEINVVIPSLHEQKRIAEDLDKVDEMIALRQQQLSKLDEVVKSRFIEMFGSDVPTVKLGDVCRMINGDRGKNYPSGDDFVAEGIPFVNAGHLHNRRVDFCDMNYITEDKFNQLSQGKMQSGDILYCLRGSLGKHGLVNFKRGAVASSLVILRCNQERLLPEFLLYALETPEIELQLKAANNGSSQPNLSAASVKAYDIKLPPFERQNEFVAFVEQIDKSKFEIQKSLEKLETLKKALMQKYFG